MDDPAGAASSVDEAAERDATRVDALKRLGILEKWSTPAMKTLLGVKNSMASTGPIITSGSTL